MNIVPLLPNSTKMIRLKQLTLVNVSHSREKSHSKSRQPKIYKSSSVSSIGSKLPVFNNSILKTNVRETKTVKNKDNKVLRINKLSLPFPLIIQNQSKKKESKSMSKSKITFFNETILNDVFTQLSQQKESQFVYFNEESYLKTGYSEPIIEVIKRKKKTFSNRPFSFKERVINKTSE